MAGFALRPKDLASRTQRRVRIQKAQLLAAKVSSPNFAEKSRNSPDISKGISQSGMYKFESSQVSQAVTQSKIASHKTPEVPARCGFLQILLLSLCSKFPQSVSEIPESLWQTRRIFPFSRDARRRLARSALRGVGCSPFKETALTKARILENWILRQPPIDSTVLNYAARHPAKNWI